MVQYIEYWVNNVHTDVLGFSISNHSVDYTPHASPAAYGLKFHVKQIQSVYY